MVTTQSLHPSTIMSTEFSSSEVWTHKNECGPFLDWTAESNDGSEQTVDQFLREIDMHYLFAQLNKGGFSNMQEFTKKATLEDLKMMVGRDAVKLYSELEKKFPVEVSLYKLIDS